ncbi:MAG: hypothetical protein ACHQWU_14220 [Gemmatimonadales bacterium]
MRETVRANPAQIERTVVAAAALLVMLTLGVVAHRRLQPIEKQVAALRAASQTIVSFRESYRAPTRAEAARWTAGADSLGLSVDRGSRLPLAQSVARIAETAGLRDVRVRFATLDSVFVPPRVVGGTSGIAPAEYTVVVECHGRYGGLLEFVNGLPSSVAVVRLTAGTSRGADAHYHITLAVYEAANASQAD